MSKNFDSPYDLSEGERYAHRWGYTDTRFDFDGPKSVCVTGSRYPLSGYSMPNFIPFLEEVLDITIEKDDASDEIAEKEVPEPHINEAFLAEIRKALDPDQVSVDGKSRLIHSHGQLSVDEIYKVLYGDPFKRVVDLVVYPKNEDEVRKIVEMARTHDVCIVPYGGGTNVSGALACPPEERRMIVSVDMRLMDQIIWLDEENHLACVEAGISGKRLEIELQKRGYTSGHDPDSVELATLGGWIATNASGMKKNRYGNIEEIVLEATLITPTGDVETKHVTPRNSTGIQPRSFLFGSEGNFGIISKAVIKIHPTPAARKYGLLIFPTFERGVEFLRALRGTGTIPASIRLGNNVEFRFGFAMKREPTFCGSLLQKIQKIFIHKIKGFDDQKMVACTVLMEGNTQEVRHQGKSIFGLAGKFGGINGGESNGRRAYAAIFAIAYLRDFVNRLHILGETFETSVPWNKIHQVTQAVGKELVSQAEHHNIPGKPYLAFRIPQTYHTGVCIYFTMGFYTKGLDDPSGVYHKIEQRLRQVILDNGGSLSHHHGVGKIRKGFLPQIQTQNSMNVMRKAKEAMDPGNIFGAGNGVFGETD
ncbi:MAG TPA: oxidase [Candidatus Latescibacteria bacterium]|nr:oxidase [Gemmatimonadota bacterium]HCR16742.1 oxidase [Candidatus Latescibacterota bacterium]